MTKNTLALAALIVGAAGTIASADVVRDLGGGWQVVIPDAIADQIDIVADAYVVTQDGTRTLVIEKFAEFRTIDPFTGMPNGLAVTFRQVGMDSDTANRIVITDEALINNTGQTWTGFRMQLIDGGQVGFNSAATFASGLDISPFTNTTYSMGNTQVDFSGGQILPGQTWYPGLAMGGIVIDVNLSSNNPVTFTLKETPIPTPGAAALLGLGMVAGARRRR